MRSDKTAEMWAERDKTAEMWAEEQDSRDVGWGEDKTAEMWAGKRQTLPKSQEKEMMSHFKAKNVKGQAYSSRNHRAAQKDSKTC